MAATIRSFYFVIYGSGQELHRDQLPVSIAAPFANWLFRKELGQRKVREPWYLLIPENMSEPASSREPLDPLAPDAQSEDLPAQSTPTLCLHPKARIRRFQVRILNFQKELYREHHDVDEIFRPSAARLLRQGIAKGRIPADREPYYYAIIPSTHAVYTMSYDLLPEDAYRVEGVFRLPPRKPDEPRIRFRAVPQPPLPERDPTTFGLVQTHGKGEPRAGRVLLPRAIYEDLRQNLEFSARIEQGGYLLGNAYRLPGSPEREDGPDFRWLVEITDRLMAEDTVSTAVNLLFTGDSWSKISRRRDRDFADRQLIGWFHTHLFPASDNFGLSGMDQDMHAWYLPRPWQIAILLNLETHGLRTVRCYQRGPEGDLVETPFEVLG